MLLAFHVGVLVMGIAPFPQYPLRNLLEVFGASWSFLPPVLVVAVLVSQHIARKDPLGVDVRTLAGMLVESILWTLPLLAVRLLRNRATAGDVSGGWLGGIVQQVLYEMGVGVYEEFVFRLVLVGLLLLLLADVFSVPEAWASAVAVVGSAIVFALAHFRLGGAWGGVPFEWGRFLFLAPAGVLWGGVLIYRGFGVAVGAHVAWNLLHRLALS
jgi:hypothetical protein